MKTTDDMIQYILNNFDFEEMHKVMSFLNWKWHDDNVPTIDKLKERAKDLLNRAVLEINSFKDKDETYFNCGGFRCIGGRREKEIYLELLFECTSWECAIYGDEEKEGEGN